MNTAKQSVAKIVHFTMTGAAMVTRARDLLLEDEPGKAYRLLALGLIGAGAEEAALAILRAEQTLTGDSSAGLSLAAEKKRVTTAFKKQVAWLYAGRFKQLGGWYRPVAWMDHLCIKVVGTPEAKWASQHASFGSPDYDRWRARFYAKEGVVEYLDVPGHGMRWVIFEACGERPHWQTPPMTAREAFAECMAVGRKLDRCLPINHDDKQEDDEFDLEPDDDEDGTRAAAIAAAEAAEETEQARLDEERDRKWQERLVEIADAVRKQADDDTFELDLSDGRTLTVPRVPFVRWALSRTEWWTQAPAWDNVATSGFKLPLDNPDHTDWMLAAGVDLKESYNGVVSDAAWSEAFRIQQRAREDAAPKQAFAGIFKAIDSLRGSRVDAAVIIDGGECTGVVGVDIAVLQDSNADRVGEIDGCKGVIVERGGPLAHLVIVSRERDLTVMRCADACNRFPKGTTVCLNPSTGRITVIEQAP